MKNKNKDIYKVNVYMIDNCINPTIADNEIKEMADILKSAPIKMVKELLVYKRFGKFREIITDKEIAGLERWIFAGSVEYYITKKSPLFFCYSDSKNTSFLTFEPIKEKLVDPEQLEEYLTLNLKKIDKTVNYNYADSKELFKFELENLERQAEEEFKTFTQKNIIFTKDMKKRNKVKMKEIMKNYNI